MAVAAQTFFQQALDRAQAQAQRQSAQLRLWGGIRLLVFVLAILMATGVLGLDGMLRWVLTGLLIIGFAGSILLYRIREVARDRARQQVLLAEGQLKSLSGDHSAWNDGAGFADSQHSYAADLDLFGPHSVYRMLNRAFLDEGQAELARTLLEWDTDHASIARNQGAVRTLSQDLDWCFELVTDAALAAQTQPSTAQIRGWAQSGNAHVRKGMFRWMHLLIPIYSLGIIAASVLGWVSASLTSVLVLVPLGVVGLHLGKTQAVAEQFGKQHAALQGLSGVLERLAQAPGNAQVLEAIRANAQGAGTAMRGLSRIANAFDNRHNLLVSVVFNLLVGWDFWCLKRLEAWHAAHGKNLQVWLNTLARAEVLTSMGLYASSQPGLVWPQPSDTHHIHANALGHPLLDPDVRVNNDFELKQGEFSIVTGANMAGKSTFLRTLGVNLVLAQAGAPVVAEAFAFRSTPLFSSMRTTDALEDNASYFYAELRRLQMLIELLESGQEHFVVLDEILKGTNSKDKAEGSRKFLEKLTRLPATGVIATHDLSLCAVADGYPQVSNLYFDVTVADDDLDFDYILRPGVCSNMNATFLMEKMGITR